jgi:hypothetical protein
MTETKPVDNQILLSEIDKNLAVAGQESAVVPFIAALAKQLQRSAEQLLAAGDTWAVELESVGREELLPRSLAFYFHYQWVDGAKYFLVLWRNVLFENLKAHLLNMDGQLLTSQLRDLQHDSQEQLLAAKDELDQLWHSATQTAGSTAKSTRQQLESWFLQNHPWPVYRKQVETICTQAAGLLEQHRVLTHDSSYVQQIRKLVQETLEACENEVTVHLEMAVDGNNFLEDQENNKAAKVVIYIEQLESKIIQRKHSKHFTQQLDHQLHALTATTSIPVSSTGLTLQSKDINFQRHISRWLDSEILPLLYEVWEITIHVRNSLKMALINIRNRAIILKNEAVEAPTTANSRDDLKQALDIFRQQTQTRQGELAELQQLIGQRLDKDLRLSNIFRENELFLRIPLQSTFNQLRSNQNELLVSFRAWGERQWRRINRYLLSVQQEESLSAAEKTVRYLQSRSIQEKNHPYTSIFLTKGYIGESFWVGRKAELQRATHLIKHWRQGYRGAVLLTGNRFSGKSLFGDLISNKFFPDETIRLLPSSTFALEGRSFNTTYDLGEALDFVANQHLNYKPLIWLDDLELWQDAETTMAYNVSQLHRHIDQYAGRIFYLVSTGNALLNLLQRTQQIDTHFQATISLDTMSKEEISQAVLIRHSATHKELVGPDNSTVLPADFQRMISRIYRTCRGNIGEALNLWAYAAQLEDNDRVSQQMPIHYRLPDFIDPDSGLLLRILLLERRTTEYRLRQRFGPAFNPRYSGALRRLISLGIIQRQLDNWLELNEAATNDTTHLLEQKQYLNFKY